MMSSMKGVLPPKAEEAISQLQEKASKATERVPIKNYKTSIRIFTSVIVILTVYDFWTETISSKKFRGLIQESQDNKQNAEAILHNREPPAWKRALEEEDDNTKTGISRGILSNKPLSFFQNIQDDIDNSNLTERCLRYGFQPPSDDYLKQHPHRRRVFFGSLIASESWELLDIVATETYKLFEGVVFVESNRTQMFHPRATVWENQRNQNKLKLLFGANQLQVRQFVNEDPKLKELPREDTQRDEILQGWIEMGMQEEDIGYLADVDETFSRDYLRAVQSCEIPEFDYKKNHCDSRFVKMIGQTRIFETSPECVVKDRVWFHPDMVIGGCLEGIGVGPKAPRNGADRAYGYGGCQGGVENIHDSTEHPLYSSSDIRNACGGRFFPAKRPAPNHTSHSAYHLHNFFLNLQTTRFKYLTYGHPRKDALTAPLEDLHIDLKLMVRCVRNWTEAPFDKQLPDWQEFHRSPGGVAHSPAPFPIYFLDQDYRHRKHYLTRLQVEKDEEHRRQKLEMTPLDRHIEDATQEAKEARRVYWVKEAYVKTLHEQRNKLKKTTKGGNSPQSLPK